MSLIAIARKDFQETVRSRGMIALVVLFSLLVAAFAFAVRPTAESEQFATEVLLSVFIGPFLVTTLVPLVGVVVGYNAVSGERESGSLKLLLSLPHSRADVVFGKVVGRGAALALAVFAGFLLPALVLIAAPVVFNGGAFLGYTVFAAALGVVFVSIAVGFSAASSTQRRALIGGVAIYVLFVLLWGAVTGRLVGAAGPLVDALPVSATQLRVFLRVSNPTTAVEALSNAFLGEQLFSGETANRQLSAAAMLVFWTLAPPLAGLLKFDADDL
ncbi:ABC transporter permease subunit [Halorubrum ezzemoulense]|jgi:ABC-2 type transport system permease protein|uniref:ABC transporter n=1 Tax=Halorubrum ezzemoulense DSM 17463 TaxID=1121945 RepID=A0A1X4H8T4_HALEZ|nr:ABC transporter permease subunit [Halorubrum ezzemoulense]MDB2225562.1 ABC transporter permease subunit [Halorubrum ezzemoulense]MDB2238410.1 ABC transporter permease subunit [Halorubrum ezzemoulense]MDB2247880.1 ABC transporter permease subunit [Halorubrum ezzemoulense]MDB2260576.1 ABC transporter permease subunit [Halorubrum ezzemoulense]MDB2265001.1 ABC transporter permease subunit [Halorubrum ezzemoulense]